MEHFYYQVVGELTYKVLCGIAILNITINGGFNQAWEGRRHMEPS